MKQTRVENWFSFSKNSQNYTGSDHEVYFPSFPQPQTDQPSIVKNYKKSCYLCFKAASSPESINLDDHSLSLFAGPLAILAQQLHSEWLACELLYLFSFPCNDNEVGIDLNWINSIMLIDRKGGDEERDWRIKRITPHQSFNHPPPPPPAPWLLRFIFILIHAKLSVNAMHWKLCVCAWVIANLYSRRV